MLFVVIESALPKGECFVRPIIQLRIDYPAAAGSIKSAIIIFSINKTKYLFAQSCMLPSTEQGAQSFVPRSSLCLHSCAGAHMLTY